jgi:hypothetical protein
MRRRYKDLVKWNNRDKLELFDAISLYGYLCFNNYYSALLVSDDHVTYLIAVSHS